MEWPIFAEYAKFTEKNEKNENHPPRARDLTGSAIPAETVTFPKNKTSKLFGIILVKKPVSAWVAWRLGLSEPPIHQQHAIWTSWTTLTARHTCI
jgi:hypothetical protein